VDRNDRILASVLRERSHHGGLGAVRSEWFVVAAVLVVVAVVLGFQLGVVQRGGDSKRVDGSVADSSTASQATAPARVAADAGQSAAAASQAAPQATAVETPGAPPSAGRRITRYVVQPGDSLQMIAVRNHLNPATLVSVNDLEDPDILQPGRELVIPSTDGFVHVVEPGETLRSIADRYGSQTADLIDANALSAPDTITVGLRLFIPRVAADR